jgi:hypothetical protein
MKSESFGEFDYAKAWVVFWFASTVCSFCAGALAGAFMGGIMAVMGWSVENVRLFGGIMGFLISIPVSYLLFRFVVAYFVVRKLSPPVTNEPAPLS